MTTLLDPAPPQEYAPEPPRRSISRGRKALIGLMAIAAVGAVSGGGTFASFSASTDNSATNAFRTAKFELGNNVEADAATQCLSSSNNLVGTNASTCAPLFPGLVSANTMLPGTEYFSGVVIENTGDSDGHLYVHAKATCTTTGGKTVNLCGEVKLRIQEYAFDSAADGVGDPGTGNALPHWDDTDKQWETTSTSNTALPAVGWCLWDATTSTTTACTGTVTNNGGFASAFPTIGSKLDADDAVLPFDNDGPANDAANHDLRFFTVSAVLDKALDTGLTGCTDRSDTYSDAGVGCANEIANGGADLTLRWLMQES